MEYYMQQRDAPSRVLFYIRWDASPRQDLGLHGVEPVALTHAELDLHSVVWIVVKEKPTVGHKLCI